MATLFEKLEKKQRKTSFIKSDEATFYFENRVILAEVDSYAYYMKAEDPFDIIRANIIIRAILNKKRIENAFSNKMKTASNEDNDSISLNEYMQDAMAELPFAKSELGPTKIYVPIFSYNLNSIYAGDFEKILIPPYLSLLQNYEAIAVDPFDYYGASIFDSHFTKFILISSKGGVSAFYDFDSEAIYFVNKQGRLDNKICLFDVYLEAPDHNHMLSRIEPVINAYFDMNRDEVERTLVENKLISSRLIQRIRIKRHKKYVRAYGEESK